MNVEILNDWVTLQVRFSDSLPERCVKWGKIASSFKIDEYHLCLWLWRSQIADVCSILIYIKHKMYTSTWAVGAWLRKTRVLNDSA